MVICELLSLVTDAAEDMQEQRNRATAKHCVHSGLATLDNGRTPSVVATALAIRRNAVKLARLIDSVKSDLY